MSQPPRKMGRGLRSSQISVNYITHNAMKIPNIVTQGGLMNFALDVFPIEEDFLRLWLFGLQDWLTFKSFQLFYVLKAFKPGHA